MTPLNVEDNALSSIADAFYRYSLATLTEHSRRRTRGKTKRPKRCQRNKESAENWRTKQVQPGSLDPSYEKNDDTLDAPDGYTSRVHSGRRRVPPTESRDPAATPSPDGEWICRHQDQRRFAITISKFSKAPKCLAKGTVAAYAKRNPLAIYAITDIASMTLKSVLQFPFERNQEANDTDRPQPTQPKPS